MNGRWRQRMLAVALAAAAIPGALSPLITMLYLGGAGGIHPYAAPTVCSSGPCTAVGVLLMFPDGGTWVAVDLTGPIAPDIEYHPFQLSPLEPQATPTPRERAV